MLWLAAVEISAYALFDNAAIAGRCHCPVICRQVSRIPQTQKSFSEAMNTE